MKPEIHDIYYELLGAGVTLSNHGSDLQAKVTPESTAIVDRYRYKAQVVMFLSATDNALWYHIQFAYAPFWEQKGSASAKPKWLEPFSKIDVLGNPTAFSERFMERPPKGEVFDPDRDAFVKDRQGD